MVTVEKINTEYEMNIGAPLPKLISDDNNLILIFNIDYFPLSTQTEKIIEYNQESNSGISILKFKHPIIHKFGSPNDEVIIGHPYYNLGLKPYLFYKINDSPWIKDIIKLNSLHPYFDKDKFNNLHYFILTFKDNTFECIAENYSVQYSSDSIKRSMVKVIDSLSD